MRAILSFPNAVVKEGIKSGVDSSDDPYGESRLSDMKQPAMSKRQLAREKRSERADRLRQKYPDMPGIPQMIGKKLRRSLINKYKNQMEAGASSSTSTKHVLGSQPIRETLLSDTQMAATQAFITMNSPALASLPPKPAIFLKMANGASASQSIAGNSSLEPILID